MKYPMSFKIYDEFTINYTTYITFVWQKILSFLEINGYAKYAKSIQLDSKSFVTDRHERISKYNRLFNCESFLQNYFRKLFSSPVTKILYHSLNQFHYIRGSMLI
jgi:hypothetical protein